MSNETPAPESPAPGGAMSAVFDFLNGMAKFAEEHGITAEPDGGEGEPDRPAPRGVTIVFREGPSGSLTDPHATLIEVNEAGALIVWHYVQNGTSEEPAHIYAPGTWASAHYDSAGTA